MCDSNTLSVIDAVVAETIQANELFTAFDVSLRVQGILKSRNLFDHNQHRHQHLKNDVHQVIAQYLSAGTYNRQLRDVGAPTDAFVYYPIGTDPSTYVPLKRKDSPVATANPFVIDTSASVVSTPAPVANLTLATDGASDDDGDGRKPDARGTVCVPNHLLRSAGFVPGDTAIVFAANTNWGNNGSKKCLMLTKTLQIGATSLTTYTVDVNCNVRITQSVFVASGLLGATYDFDGNSQAVYVKPN